MDALLESKYIWSPPGNISNLSYRYFEALICGAVPLAPPSTVQDPHLWENWAQDLSIKLFSWKNLLKFAAELQELERMKIRDQEFEKEINAIHEIKKELLIFGLK